MQNKTSGRERSKVSSVATGAVIRMAAGTVPVVALLLTTIVALYVQPSRAAPEEALAPDEARAGSLLLRMRDGYRAATRINTDVDLDVSGLTIRAVVRQTFRNDGPEWVEGTYVFPLPDAAAVDHMRLKVGERVIESEIQEKRTAEASYQKAKSAGKRASLVRQQRANLFTTTVANIGPGETVSIEIEYLDTARFDAGTFSLRFPMTLTPRYIPGRTTGDRQGSGWSSDTTRVADASRITPPMVTHSADHRITLRARVASGMPLAFIGSRYHPVDVSQTADSYEVSFSQSGVPADHDFELTWRPARGAEPQAMLFEETVAEQPHILLMLVPPDDDVSAIEIAPRDLVFVIDTSGSMHGVSIEQARRSLELALDGLRPVDRFNVIQFNATTNALFPESVDASPSNVSRARHYVARLTANGGTEMRPALQRALTAGADSNYLKQIIFITDGSVGNENELFKLIEQHLGTSRLFTVGIGSAPNSWFMRKAAEAGRGAFVTISALHEVEEKMGRLFRKIEKPMVTGIVMEWPDELEAETYPATVPDLYSGEPIVIKARLRRGALASDVLRIN
ncbi:MAG: marine proteobacterial sortase target protein, partial [Pseudomonadota bacterium]